MGKWWILPERITKPIIEEWHKQARDTGIFKERIARFFREFVRIKLKDFDDKHLTIFYSNKANDVPSSDTFLRALNLHTDSNGVYIRNDDGKELLNLMCYFGFKKSWLDTLLEQKHE